jgi:hypothetical protein
VIRWFIVVFLALLIINSFAPFLQRIGLGKLPGDFRFRWLGREWFLPVTMTIILSVLTSLIAKLV